jgi:hypothetical protein
MRRNQFVVYLEWKPVSIDHDHVLSRIACRDKGDLAYSSCSSECVMSWKLINAESVKAS